MRSLRIAPPPGSSIKNAVLWALVVVPISLGAPPQTPPSRAPDVAPQAKSLAFEVASIKLTPPEFSGSRASAPISGSSLSLQGMSLKDLIHLAYTLPPDLIGGGPGWVDDTRYDLEAKAAGKGP